MIENQSIKPSAQFDTLQNGTHIIQVSHVTGTGDHSAGIACFQVIQHVDFTSRQNQEMLGTRREKMLCNGQTNPRGGAGNENGARGWMLGLVP